MGTVGRLVAVKDHASLIRAFAKLHATDAEARLLLVGDGPEMKNLREDVEQAGLSEQVILAGDRRDVPALLAALDLYAVSSLSEGFSISILEAMSCGLALVATDVGGNAEIIEASQNGLLVPAADADKLFEAMLELRRNERLRREMAQRNRRKIEQGYSMQAMLRHYLELYRS